MAWYAIENIEEAVEESKEVLLPFNLGTWFRLAVIVALTSGVGLSNIPSAPSSGPGSDTSFETGNTDLTADNIDLNALTGASVHSPSSVALMALTSVLLFVVLLFYISSVFEFIFYQSLLDKDVSIRDNFSLHKGNGLRYLGFRVAYLASILLLIGIAAVSFMVNPVIGVLGIMPVLVAGLVLMLVASLTQDFVLPKMVESERKLLDSWRALWPDIRSEWRQVAVYLLVKIGLGIAVGIVKTVAVIIWTLTVLVPVAFIGGLLYFFSPFLAVIPLVTGIIAWVIGLLFISVPFSTYLYMYVIQVYLDLTG